MSAQTLAAAVAAGVAATCTVIVAMRLARVPSRPAPLIAWTIGFALFTTASLAPLDGAARGWSARTVSHHLAECGWSPTWRSARCCSSCRGAPSPRPAAATMLFLTFRRNRGRVTARIDACRRARARRCHSRTAPPRAVAHRCWRSRSNSAGTPVLLAGSIPSARRRQRSPRLRLPGGGGSAGHRARPTATRLGSYTPFAPRPGRGRDPDPARPGYAETFVRLGTRRAAHLRREAALRWIADRDAALSTRTTKRRRAARPAGVARGTASSSRR